MASSMARGPSSAACSMHFARAPLKWVVPVCARQPDGTGVKPGYCDSHRRESRRPSHATASAHCPASAT